MELGPKLSSLIANWSILITYIVGKKFTDVLTWNLRALSLYHWAITSMGLISVPRHGRTSLESSQRVCWISSINKYTFFALALPLISISIYEVNRQETKIQALPWIPPPKTQTCLQTRSHWQKKRDCGSMQALLCLKTNLRTLYSCTMEGQF